MRRFILLPLLVLIGCTTSQDAVNLIMPRYAGQKADVFFSENGPPSSQYQMEDGSRIYRWSSGESHVHTPSTTTFNAAITPYNPGSRGLTVLGAFLGYRHCIPRGVEP